MSKIQRKIKQLTILTGGLIVAVFASMPVASYAKTATSGTQTVSLTVRPTLTLTINVLGSTDGSDPEPNMLFSVYPGVLSQNSFTAGVTGSGSYNLYVSGSGASNDETDLTLYNGATPDPSHTIPGTGCKIMDGTSAAVAYETTAVSPYYDDTRPVSACWNAKIASTGSYAPISVGLTSPIATGTASNVSTEHTIAVGIAASSEVAPGTYKGALSVTVSSNGS